MKRHRFVETIKPTEAKVAELSILANSLASRYDLFLWQCKKHKLIPTIKMYRVWLGCQGYEDVDGCVKGN